MNILHSGLFACSRPFTQLTYIMLQSMEQNLATSINLFQPYAPTRKPQGFSTQTFCALWRTYC